MRRVSCLVLCSLAIAGCSSSNRAATAGSTVVASSTTALGTAAPVTVAVATSDATKPTAAPDPTTKQATTTPPITPAPVTIAPVTIPPVTPAPVTIAPVTTVAPVTPTPVTTRQVVTTTQVAQTACAAGAYTAGATTTHHLTVGGVDRVVNVHVPPSPRQGMRLVVDFHGAGSDMIQQEVYSGFDALADRDGFVVATPNGVAAAVRQWRFLGREDADFAAAIVTELVDHACVDPAHAFAVGISSGSAMSASLACQKSQVFAGFGLVAADFYVPALCDAAVRRPMVIFHGTADPAVPYGGGPVTARGGNGLTVAPAEESAAAWAAHPGCQPGPTSTSLGTEVTRLDWSGCAVPVVMYRIEGGGHTWPGAAIAVDRLGPTTRQIDATEIMWQTFAAVP